MLRVLASLGITLLISVLFGLGAHFLHLSFWGIFLIAFLLQLLFFYVWNGYQQTLIILKTEQIENERIAELAKQGLVVKCAFCKQPNFVLLRFDKDNEFKCEKCNKTSSVYINVETAQQSIPISSIQAAQLTQKELDDLAQTAIKNATP